MEVENSTGNASRVRSLFALWSLFLTACGPSVYSVTQERLYSPSEYRYAAGGKAVHTVIKGNPFTLPDEALAEQILATMGHASASFDTALVRPATFTTGPGTRPSYRVTLLLNPGPNTQLAALCADPEMLDVDPTREPLQARMAFCRDGTLLSTSHGTMVSVHDPANPHFQRMIHSMTRELFQHREFRRNASKGLLFE